MKVVKSKNNQNIKELLEFGIINLDKPSGPTSFEVSDKAKKILGVRKTSHFGTLDPKVTGVLPIALNRACKLTGFFLGEDKEYVGIMHIHEEISKEDLEKTIKEKFTGVITQLPPVRSRVKRQEREREIKIFEILEKNNGDFLFRTTVQGGTYIRKLIHDLGEHLKMGAHMLELRRTRAGIFEENNKDYPAITLYDLEKAVEDFEKGNEESLRKIIIPGEEAVKKIFEVVKIKEESVDRILHGQPIYYKNLEKKQDFEKDEKIAVFCEDKFVGIFRVSNEKETFATSEFTFQEIK
jgi:H/ACA ribonucleoprotein complex subunit 4